MEKGRLIRMAKVNIIYWSGTGNTAAMAAAIAEGAKEAGAEAELITAETASADDVRDAKAIALGCPSMGADRKSTRLNSSHSSQSRMPSSA